MRKISDFNSATEKYPVVYAGSATRPEFVDMPTTLQQQEGVAPMDTLPAQWWNAMWKLATKDINAFRDYVGDAITEINNLLTQFSIALDDADSEQLYDFFHDTYVQNYLSTIFLSKNGGTIDGDLHVKGDLSVDGIGEEIISTELKVGANTITLRNDNPSALGNTELAGVVTENYDGNNHNNIIAIDKNGVARTGDIDIATRLLYSNDGTNFYTDADLTTPAVIGTGEEVRDTGNQTTGGVEIYEGITYSNNDTQALATREDNPVDGAFMRWDATLKMLVSASASVQFDIAWPIGVTYTQYPGQKDPNELWGAYSTWVELNYGGAFFRTSGGNASAFNAGAYVSGISGTTITINAHGLTVGSVLYDKDNNEARVITAVTDVNHVVVDSAFTSASITTLLITQNSQNVAHNHTAVSAGQHSHSTNTTKNSAGTADKSLTGIYKYAADTAGCWNGNGLSGIFSAVSDTSITTGLQPSNNYNKYKVQIDATHSHTTNEVAAHTHTINSSGGTETRTVNFTKKIWLRTA